MAKVVGTKGGLVEIYGLEREKDDYKFGLETGSVYVAVDTGEIYLFQETFDADGVSTGGIWRPF